MFNSQDLADAGQIGEENRLTRNPSTPLPPEKSLLTFQTIERAIILGFSSGHGTAYPTLHEIICKNSSY